jgi:hypothetical protein
VFELKTKQITENDLTIACVLILNNEYNANENGLNSTHYIVVFVMRSMSLPHIIQSVYSSV